MFIIKLYVAGVVRGVGVLEFSVEPRDVSVSAGGSAVLDCAAQSSDHNRSKIMIQWQDEHGQPVTFIGDTYRSQLTNNSLYVSRVADGETAGVYQCRASLPNGWSVVSRRARVEVARLGAWEAEPGDVTVRAGGRAYLACRPATSAARRTRWLKDGRPLHVDELRMAVLPGGALEIDGVQPQDAGTYRCNVSVLEEHALSRPAHVAITSGVDDDDDAGEPTPPRFVAVPRDARAVEGDTITLDCSADGRPQPRVAWLKDGRAIDLAHLDTRYSTAGATGGALQVSDVREGDAGTYTCRADNGEDSADAAAELRVLVPPRFVRRPQDRLGQLNADTEFRCEVYGRPEPRVVWLKNSETITYNDYLTLVNGHDLRITGLIDDDTGIFQCVAANEAGNVQASARLKVIGQPGT